MDKVNELTKSQKDEDKLLIAKVLDKIKLMEARNRFENTDFLDLAQKSKIEEVLKKRNIKSYKIFGGYNEAERCMLVILPDIFIELSEEELIDKLYSQIISIVRVSLPKEITYEHRDYLGALMKLGVKREKVGDILVRKDGADIIVSTDILKFLLTNLKSLTRFQKAEINEIKISELEYIENEKKIIKVNVPSMRLDCIVGEVAKCSRNQAKSIIESERVFVNFEEEIRITRQIKENDIITIRGKGRFKIEKIMGNTRSRRINLEVMKW